MQDEKFIIPPEELITINHPGQYIGGEFGQIIKNDLEVSVHLCLAFPDSYAVGMSHQGLQILYSRMNQHPAIWAERAYAPKPDMELRLKELNLHLSSLESKRPLKDFDVVGFSLQYELCGTEVLTMLELGGIPRFAKDRASDAPLIIGGGPVACHPEPFAPFFDAFLIGDSEEMLLEFLLVIKQGKEAQLPRQAILEQVSNLAGVYVPSLVLDSYSESGSFNGFTSASKQPAQTKSRVVPDLAAIPIPDMPIVPNVGIVHERVSLEIMRGCLRGCRFCQAGYIYRPLRERPLESLVTQAKQALINSGFEELALLSLSSADYCAIGPLVSALDSAVGDNETINIAFPSTRIDALPDTLLTRMQSKNRSSFTLAPEAGTQRLRDVINKGFSEEQLLDTCKRVLDAGWHSIKLYFMIGLPTETDEDLQGIIETTRQIKRFTRGGQNITVSLSTFVPKPHTPFQWAEQIAPNEALRRQEIIRAGVRKIGVAFKFHDVFSTQLEGVIARGDRRISAVINRAYELGCRLDAWTEHMREELWEQAFAETGIEPLSYLRAREIEEHLPWEAIEIGIPKAWFLNEWQKAQRGELTATCLSETCSGCGACDGNGIENKTYPIQSSTETSDPSASAPLTKPALQARKPLQRLRMTYSKFGSGRFYSHLEIMRLLFRAARRAKLPVAHSEGFNPSPRMSFGPPLPLGIASNTELVDVMFYEQVTTTVVLEALNRALPAGLRIDQIVEMPLRGPSINEAIQGHLLRVPIARIAEAYHKLYPNRELNTPPSVNQLLEGWQNRLYALPRGKDNTALALGAYIAKASVDDEYLNFELRFDARHTNMKPLEAIKALLGFDISAVFVERIALLGLI